MAEWPCRAGGSNFGTPECLQEELRKAERGRKIVSHESDRKAEASTWDTQRDAESWITKAIKSDAPAIETWLAATSDTKNHVIKSTATANIGFSLTDEAWKQYKASSKGKSSKQQSIKLNKCIDKRKNFTVVLKKTADDPRGFFVLTSYPTE